MVYLWCFFFLHEHEEHILSSSFETSSHERFRHKILRLRAILHCVFLIINSLKHI